MGNEIVFSLSKAFDKVAFKIRTFGAKYFVIDKEMLRDRYKQSQRRTSFSVHL